MFRYGPGVTIGAGGAAAGRGLGELLQSVEENIGRWISSLGDLFVDFGWDPFSNNPVGFLLWAAPLVFFLAVIWVGVRIFRGFLRPSANAQDNDDDSPEQVKAPKGNAL